MKTLYLGAMVAVPAVLCLASPDGSPVLAGGIIAVSLGAGALGGRFRAGPLARVAMMLVAAGIVGGVLIGLSSGSDSLRLGHVVTLLSIALVVPLLLLEPSGKTAGWVIALGLIALSGQARSVNGWVYGATVIVFIVAALRAHMVITGGWGSILRQRRGLLAPFVLAIALTSLQTVGLSSGLLVAEEWVAQYGNFAEVGQAGFDDGAVRLGELGRVLTSSKVAMRVEPLGTSRPISRLRGQVYIDYRRGWWRKPHTTPRLTAEQDGVVLLEPARIDEAAEDLDLSIETTGETGRTVFLPARTLRLEGLPAGSMVDEIAVAFLPTTSRDEALRYRARGIWGQSPPATRPPTRGETELPDGLVEPLGALARAWTAGALTDALRVEAVRRRLMTDYEYTLEPGRPPSTRDPILHFLQHSKRGYCEHFASALALLCRALGIPSRLIGGYLVVEHNRAGGYFIVRDRDAHAWTELYIDGAWRVVDPTPPSDRSTESAWLTARIDQMKRGLAELRDRLADLSGRELGLGALVIGALLGLWIFIRRGRGTVARRDTAAPLERFEPLERLEARLARQGHVREPSSPLSHFAAVLRAAGLAQAASLVQTTARLRYGRLGDEEALREAIAAYLATDTRSAK